jgi:hypothetical protein
MIERLISINTLLIYFLNLINYNGGRVIQSIFSFIRITVGGKYALLYALATLQPSLI